MQDSKNSPRILFKAKLLAMIPLLLQWYQENKKMLPWRQTPTPYHVWISEIMLQQTRIEAVLPYYSRFLDAAPDVFALAALSEDCLMKLWEGLGYYSRARNLRKCASLLIEKYEGELPANTEELKKLPGIGEYTAGAIASIAFGLPAPAVDGNVMRVLSRLFTIPADPTLPALRKTVASELAEVYPTGKTAGALTEALMELGENVCIPNGVPKCGTCPLSGLCAAHSAGLENEYPKIAKKKARRVEDRTVFLLCADEKYALRRRQETGLLAGMLEPPNTAGFLSEEDAAAWCAEQGLSVTALVPCGNAKHLFTHVEWHMIGYRVFCSAPTQNFLWHTAAEISGEDAIPSAYSFFIREIQKTK